MCNDSCIATECEICGIVNINSWARLPLIDNMTLRQDDSETNNLSNRTELQLVKHRETTLRRISTT